MHCLVGLACAFSSPVVVGPPVVERALGVNVGLGRVAVVGTLGIPIPEGASRSSDSTQSMKMMPAMNSHIGSGYAAVGAVLKPPLEFLPIICCLWLRWPQSLGMGPAYHPAASNCGQPSTPKRSRPSMSDSSRVGFFLSTPGYWHWLPPTVLKPPPVRASTTLLPICRI